MNPRNVLILPGWQNSGFDHWQSRWERAYGYTRVDEHNWMRPLRGDWITRLEEVLLACDEPAVLVAHSLGCIQIAAWASHSRNTGRVKGALMVAPPDVEREDLHQLLPGWAPVHLAPLPFSALVFASSDDPFCDLSRARRYALAWNAELIEAGPGGHLNADSNLGDWPEVHEHLAGLMQL